MSCLWYGGRDNRSTSTSNPPLSQFDGAGSELSETNVVDANLQQDHSSGATSQFSHEPQHLDNRMYAPSGSRTHRAEVGSDRPEYMERDQRQGQDHVSEELGTFGTEEEHMEAEQMLDADGQFDNGQATGEVGFPDQVQDRQQEHEAMEHAYDNKTASVNMNQFAASIKPESMDGSQPSHFADQVANGAGFGGEAFVKQEHQADQPQYIDNELNFESVNDQAAAQILEEQQRLWPMYPSDPSRNAYDLGTTDPSAPSGQYAIHPHDPRVYLQQSQNNAFGSEFPAQNLMSGQHTDIRPEALFHMQADQSAAFGYGSPAQGVMTGQIGYTGSSQAPIIHTPESRVAGPHQQEQNSPRAPPSFQFSGHPHLSQNVKHKSPPAAIPEGTEIIDLGESSDDEPLQTRTQRHGDLVSASGSQQSSPDSESRSGHEEEESNTEEASTTFNFRLPTHEALYEKNADGLWQARVSIPGIIREAVLLSDDYSAQEYKLFVDVFLPSHLALANPDPEPALAVLNFHTIAVLVISAYHTIYESEETKGVDPKDVDADEVFFHAMDKWRIGSMSGKEGHKLIRGVQEFCDVALDLIFHIKEHGMEIYDPDKPQPRKERCDKGTKRGPRAGPTNTTGTGPGTKTITLPARGGGVAGKVNALTARKKTRKAEPVKERKKPGPKPGQKAKTGTGRPVGRPRKEEKKEKKEKLPTISVVKSGRIQK